jgi:ABC-type Fe3+-hydroxamate transport system substrate-binding protein
MPAIDDLGTAVRPTRWPVERVVSLVPSLTEAIAVTRRDRLVGATDWCTHPADLDITRVRGTKNPDVAAIIALAPDVVIANKEENRELDVRRLRDAGVAVWVTVTETVPGAIETMRRMFTDALGWDVPDWLTEVEQIWSAAPPARQRSVVIPVWRDPWMVVGRDTFTGDLAARLGLMNVFAGSADRYPHVTVEQIRAAAPDLVLLPDEPYEFSATDGPEALPGLTHALVEGRALTWYGPSLLEARGVIERAVNGAAGTGARSRTNHDRL